MKRLPFFYRFTNLLLNKIMVRYLCIFVCLVFFSTKINAQITLHFHTFEQFPLRLSSSKGETINTNEEQNFNHKKGESSNSKLLFVAPFRQSSVLLSTPNVEGIEIQTTNHPLPLQVFWGGKSNGENLPEQALENAPITVELLNFDIGLSALCPNSFYVGVYLAGKYHEMFVEGCRLNSQYAKIIASIPNGSPIILRDVKVNTWFGEKKTLKPVVFFLKKQND